MSDLATTEVSQVGRADRRPKTPREFQDHYHCGNTKFYELVRDGKLRVRKMGSRNLIMPEDEDAFIASLP
jgi:hypothetical protein